MTWIELLLTAVALSMDAFAVSTCKGLNLRVMSWKRAGIIGLFFGGFQALMPLIGWLLGGKFGVGTVIYALSIGPLIQLCLPWFSQPVSRNAVSPPREIVS